MRKFFTLKYVLLVLTLAFSSIKLSAQVTHVVISQVYGGGGNSGAVYKSDFVELFNPTSSPVSLAGWSVQYNSAAAVTGWQVTNLSGSIAPFKYFLIKMADGAAGSTALPTPNITGSIPMASNAGKVALLTTTATLAVGCPSGPTLIDFVGYGTTASCFEGASYAPAPSNTTADLRLNNGCTDNNVNSKDLRVLIYLH